MYRGERDPYVGIVVPQSICELFVDRSGMEWVEVWVPPMSLNRSFPDWFSLVVPPNQVYRVDDCYNEFFINAHAQIKLVFKSTDSKGVRVPMAQEFASTEEIRARFLNYMDYVRNGVVRGVAFYERFMERTSLSMRGVIREIYNGGLKI